MPIGETMPSNRPDSKTFEAIYLMTLAMASFVIPVTLYRYVDFTTAAISWVVITFLILDFYLRHKIREIKRKRYVALKKEEKAIVADFRANKKTLK